MITYSNTNCNCLYSVEDLRNELEDYNMARMNSFCKKENLLFFVFSYIISRDHWLISSIGDVNELKKEIDDLHAHNEQLESIINKLYLEKQKYQL